MSEAALGLRPADWSRPVVASLLWTLLLAVPLLLRLGAAPLFDVDEGAFAEATREMLASGDWGHTTLNGNDRFDKPIGVYWLQAASVTVFGLNAFSLRLPSAMCAWAMCLALVAFAAPRWGRGVGWLAGGVLGTSAGVLLIGRAATADALLNLLLVLAGLDLWRHIESGARAPLRRGYTWIGLGLLAKGPVALLVPGAAALIWVIAGRRWRLATRALTDVPGWLLLVGIAAPWYTYAWMRHGQRFVEGFLLHHNVERFAGTLEGHGGGIAYYAFVLPLLLLPWSPLLMQILRRLPALWADPLTRYLLGWAGFVLIFFSLSGTKLPHYVLYGAAPLALLMARQMASAGPGMRRALWATLVLWLIVLVGLPWLARAGAARVADPLYRALLAGAPAPWALLAGGASTLVLVAIAVASRGRFEVRYALAASGAALLLCGLATPWWGEALQGPIQRAALAARGRTEPAVQWGVHWPSFALVREQPAEHRAPRPGELALVRTDRLPPGPDPAAGTWDTVFEQRGVALILWRGTP